MQDGTSVKTFIHCEFCHLLRYGAVYSVCERTDVSEESISCIFQAKVSRARNLQAARRTDERDGGIPKNASVYQDRFFNNRVTLSYIGIWDNRDEIFAGL
jgi:hypothetical protein